MAFNSFDPKDPDDVDDFSWDWADELGSDTISTSTFTVPSGITKDSDSTTTLISTVRLSGGSVGQHEILNRITTANGRTLDNTFIVPVSEQ